MTKTPLIAVLQTATLEPFREVELPLEQFPDMVELSKSNGLTEPTVRQFFRLGITGRKAYYREGTSYRIGQ